MSCPGTGRRRRRPVRADVSIDGRRAGRGGGARPASWGGRGGRVRGADAGDGAAGGDQVGAATDGGPDPAPAAARLAVDLRPGRPDLTSFPRTAWASSIRRALSAAPYESLDYAEPAGLPVLRAAVADYVTRARGVRADASAVVITAGFTSGLALLARALHRLGMRTVATEDPGLGKHRDVLHAAGLATVPPPDGAGGADPDQPAGRTIPGHRRTAGRGGGRAARGAAARV